MANIKISDLRPSGYDLFADQESYLMSLTEDEIGTQGAGTWTAITTASSGACLSIGLTVVGVTFAASYIKGRYF
ncbi:hypothetical protein [aff. Roholtiella sp. LEGE 12411]|uniref:hypothetical protein n=1 Tax=aff. Roholtiella sp. LEGE 12411 TaxID=1828822 RepID=UPI00187F4004|nr:hypothetical protein [aff. Roholtiella sp. LEGE 12411]MBE9037073.1 hypothetical protein [aff. Roholtiella sp. LEGE 12411]